MKQGTIALVMLTGLMSATAGAEQVKNSAYLNSSYLNGKYLNGKYLNGKYLNSGLINGGYVDGAYIGGMTRGADSIYYVGLDRSELVGYTIEYDQRFGSWYWASHRGSWFVGAHLNATVVKPGTSDRDIADVRIDSFERAPQPDDDVTVYTLSVNLVDPQTNVGEWHPICGRDDQGAPIKAIPLQGIWNYEDGAWWGGAKVSDSADLVTFACLNAAIGKCAAASYPYTMGYKPWTPPQWTWLCDADGSCGWTYTDRKDFHQACTRMVRDDFCGDGRTHTLNGMPIDVYDVLGRAPDHGEPWQFEAGWTPDGAPWVSCYRVMPLEHDECPVYTAPDDSKKQHLTLRACAYPATEEPVLPPGDLIGDRVLDPKSVLFELDPPPSI
jgi:hypothetical protein